MKKSLVLLSVIAVCLWSINTFGAVAEDFRKDAEQGNAEAQFSLGICYANGNGVAKDMTKAVEWYRKAAEQGHDKAQFNLCLCYANSDGVAKDMTEAAKW